YICYDCVNEYHLKTIIKKEGFIVKCSYCGNDYLEGVLLSYFVDKIDIAFEQHYIRSSEYPPENWSIYKIKNSDFWEPDGMPVIEAIMDAAEIDEEIAADIQQILAERYYDRSAAEIGETTDFNNETFYDTKNPEDLDWQLQWANFEHVLKTSTRFFNKNNEELLKSVFQKIEFLNTHDEKPVVRIIGPETDITHIYRARAFQSDFKLKSALETPDKELGPPPSQFATAGRMNARGITVFYGSINSETALAEIRPPVGCKVAVARFELKRLLKVLDLSALNYTHANGSIFDEDYANELSRIMFLRKLSQRMTKPVMPDDEHSEYLATQFIADFLASELKFDGIIFPSAQFKKGLNVTLFHSASRVVSLEYPEGTNITVSLIEYDDEGVLPNYTVSVSFPKKKIKDNDSNPAWCDLPGIDWESKDLDLREKTLSIDVDSIKVEHIDSIQIKSTGFDVNWT
ncbi:RES family NAD+ phosphorylase, partial [Flavobacterium sp. FPG59]|uniref:RES family NAD+ phosphorylase n=1 Tax=Flavobacterium sp. FPG59 TaxID=1929267 RepID=UPI000A3BB5F1